MITSLIDIAFMITHPSFLSGIKHSMPMVVEFHGVAGEKSVDIHTQRISYIPSKTGEGEEVGGKSWFLELSWPKGWQLKMTRNSCV